jgi:predicted RNase H-like HicB family nuclease
MNDDLFEKAKQLAARPYPFRVYRDAESDPDVMYLAENVDLDGCMAQGSTQKEAIQNLADARIDYMAFLLEKGLPVPEPSEFTATSSQAAIPNTLYITTVEPDDDSNAVATTVRFRSNT